MEEHVVLALFSVIYSLRSSDIAFIWIERAYKNYRNICQKELSIEAHNKEIFRNNLKKLSDLGIISFRNLSKWTEHKGQYQSVVLSLIVLKDDYESELIYRLF